MSKTFKTREFSRRQYSFQSELGAEELLKSLGWESTSQFLSEKKDWADILKIQYAYLGWGNDVSWTVFVLKCSGLWIEFINDQIVLRSKRQFSIQEMEFLYTDHDDDNLFCFRNGGMCEGYKQSDLTALEYCKDCKYTHWEINEDFSERDFNSCGKKVSIIE